MASADWSPLSDQTSGSSIANGPATPAVVPTPNGGAAFVYAAHSLVNAAGVIGFYSALSGFTPMAKAGDVSGALWKGGAGGLSHSEFLFICLNGQASTNSCYMLGLSNAEPAHLVLVKGQLAGGLPDVAPGSNGVLRQSTATFASLTWVQLKVEAITEPNGDVVINCYQSDLTVNPVTAPVWTAIPGMAAFTDDALRVNTGSAPLTSGRVGYAMVSGDINRLGAFAQITTDRQILP